MIQGDARGGRMRGRSRNFRGRGRFGDNSRSGVQRQGMQQRQQSINESVKGGLRPFRRFSRDQRQCSQRFGSGLQNIQCFKCKKCGHYQSHCWSSQGRNSDEGSNSSNTPSSSDYGNLFMVHNGEEVNNSSIWLLDSDTSNNMTGRRDFFS